MLSYGWAGKILRIDLTTGKIKVDFTMKYAEKFLGGSGLGAKILYDEVPPRIKPLDPESSVIISVGPLVGTSPSACKGEIIFKSPVTQWYADSSFGGFFSVELKLAGYDAIIIRGKSSNPVYLWINNDEVKLLDASHLWGKDTVETEEIIRRDHSDPEIKTLRIGPAGENLVYGACVVADEGRVAGRYGSGAVFGSKNLKAIAVRGTGDIKIAKPEKLADIWAEILERVKRDPLYDYFAKQHRGTMTIGDILLSVYVENKVISPEYLEKLHSDIFLREFVLKTTACYGCPLGCRHWHIVKEGPYRGTYAAGFEFNTFGDYCIVLRTYDLSFASEVDAYCDRMGIGVDEPSDLIYALMRMYEDGKITSNDVDGLDLTWGNKEAIMTLLEKYVKREGIGAVLADGPRSLVEKFRDKNAEKYVPITNRGTFARGTLIQGIAFGLAISTSTRGADYLKGAPSFAERILRLAQIKPYKIANITEEDAKKLGEERFGDPEILLNMYSTKGKPKMVIMAERIFTICDATGICKYISWGGLWVNGIQLEDFAELLTAVTGKTYTTDELIVIADRINAIQRAYNAREGKRRDEEPYELRVGMRQPIDSQTFEKLLDEYYAMRGFNKDGIPTKKKLEELGLREVADDLKKHGVPID